MQDIILITAYFIGLFALCAFIRYRDEEDSVYFFALIWPVLLFGVPFFVVGWAGVKVGDAIKLWRHDC